MMRTRRVYPWQAFWQQRSPDERRWLAAGGVALVGLLSLWGLLTLHDGWRAAQQQEVAMRARLQHFEQRAAELAHYRVQPQDASRGGFDGSLLAYTDQRLRQHSLQDALARLQPDGEHQVRLWFEDAVLDDVLRWLGDLATAGVDAEAMVVEALPSPGRADIRLQLIAPGRQ